MHTGYTVVLADGALSTGDTSLVRRLFARLPRDEQIGVVPTAVWRLLAEVDDDDAYPIGCSSCWTTSGSTTRWSKLAAAAVTSEDPLVREVGREFCPDGVVD